MASSIRRFNLEFMEKETFTIREKIALKLVIILMVILKPTKWAHEYTNELKAIKELIDSN